ncbi:hypothetical protein K3495_g673 [Podosphaera aphanis]|nr:hypothetical protein K3495_g673 [Podosphaera aphanis]
MMLPRLTLTFFAVALLSLTIEVLAVCKSFEQSRNYYTLRSPDEQIISPGYVCDVPNSDYVLPTDQRCDATTECPGQTAGIVNTVGSNNLSLSHDDVLPLYALIPSKTYYTPPSFLYSLSGNITSKTSCLKAHTANGTVNDTTTAGYFSFVPTLLCIEGELYDCNDGPVEDGTAIKLCAVNALDMGADGIIPNGVQQWVESDVITASNLTQNPAYTRVPVPTEAGISLEDLGISGAGRSFGLNLWFGIGVSFIAGVWL